MGIILTTLLTVKTMFKTLPNFLTVLRIIFIPIFVVVFYLPWQHAHFAAAAIFFAAAATDWWDGFLARRLGQMSRFGAFLDPVADKLIVSTRFDHDCCGATASLLQSCPRLSLLVEKL